MKRAFRRVLAIAGACALLAVGFAWGFAAHRNHVVPYWPVKRALRAVGLARIPPQAKVRRNELDPDRATHEQARLELLQALPYVAGTFDPHPERKGVTLYDRQRAFPGLNLYSPANETAAYLVTMDGRVVHRWSRDEDGGIPWFHVAPLPEGALLVSVSDQRLMKLDRRSNLVWSVRARFHHDNWIDDDGRIYALVRREDRIPAIDPDVDCVVDWVEVLSPDGDVLDELSVLDAIRRSPYAYLLPLSEVGTLDRDDGAIDVLHTNHVEVFDGHLADRSPLFARGNLLLSLRALSAVVILDGKTHEVLWLWGPNNLLYQHDPTLLDNGHLLIFDNGIKRSRIVELDPLTERIVWRYTADDLFSRSRGSVQRLPNGNTLITETNTGYVFEVTPEGERVWTFADPHFTPDGRRAAIWRMRRFAPGELPFEVPVAEDRSAAGGS